MSWAITKKAINSDLTEPLNYLMYTQDLIMSGDASYIWNNQEKIEDLYNNSDLFTKSPVALVQCISNTYIGNQILANNNDWSVILGSKSALSLMFSTPIINNVLSNSSGVGFLLDPVTSRGVDGFWQDEVLSQAFYEASSFIPSTFYTPLSYINGRIGSGKAVALRSSSSDISGSAKISFKIDLTDKTSLTVYTAGITGETLTTSTFHFAGIQINETTVYSSANQPTTPTIRTIDVSSYSGLCTVNLCGWYNYEVGDSRKNNGAVFYDLCVE